MTLRNGSWTNRTDPMYDRWWVVLLQLAVIAAAIVCCMNEAGCFDK